MLSRDNASQAIVSGLPTIRPGMPEETLAGYNARSLGTGWGADWFWGGNMAMAKIELPPKFDFGSKLTPWEQRHAEGKKLCRAVPRESQREVGSRHKGVYQDLAFCACRIED